MNQVRHRWTEEEKQIVRRDYQGTNASRDEIAARLGVTPYAVAGMVSKLGLAKKTDRRPWNDQEDERLAELVEEHPVWRIAKLMNRSVNSVTVRAVRLRCSRRKRSGWFTKAEVCEILGMDHKWVQKRIDDGRLPASSHYGGRVQKNGLSAWHIKEKDLRSYLRANAHELNGRNVDLTQVVDILAGLTY